jgi:hypothetical protein
MVRTASAPLHARHRLASLTVLLVLLLAAFAAGGTGRSQAAVVAQQPSSAPTSSSGGGGSLESAASKAGDTGRKVAMSLLALGLAIAAIVLAFKRDFREAVGVFAVGIVAVALATPAGLNVLRDTVGSLFGGR